MYIRAYSAPPGLLAEFKGEGLLLRKEGWEVRAMKGRGKGRVGKGREGKGRGEKGKGRKSKREEEGLRHGY